MSKHNSLVCWSGLIAAVGSSMHAPTNAVPIELRCQYAAKRSHQHMRPCHMGEHNNHHQTNITLRHNETISCNVAYTRFIALVGPSMYAQSHVDPIQVRCQYVAKHSHLHVSPSQIDERNNHQQSNISSRHFANISCYVAFAWPNIWIYKKQNLYLEQKNRSACKYIEKVLWTHQREHDVTPVGHVFN